jgi:hypothetical protein
MRAEDLVFWLDALRPDTHQSNGVLCRRHAESMVLPRHWTLDDLREPVPRLFQPPVAAPATPTAARRRRSSVVTEGEQLLLGAHESVGDPRATDAPDGGSSPLTLDESGTVSRAEDVAVADVVDVAGPAVPWTPTFDENDDLGGLLSARSPLLARAFRGDDRPRQA